MAILSMNNGLSTTTVAELDDAEIRKLIDHIGLLDRDTDYIRGEAAAFGADTDREWAAKFVAAYPGELIIG